MRQLLPGVAAAAALAASVLPAHGATPIGDYFSIGGFGTLGGVVTNSNEGQYGHDRQGGGADRNPALDVDSNFGVQLDGKATSWLSGTVQALSVKRLDQGFTTRIEWAYALLKPVDGLSIRAGRMATPTFLVSDSRNIGYANNWLRAPNEVYALNIFPNFDGADIAYRRSVGPVSLNLKALAGKSGVRVLGSPGDGTNLRGVSLEVETDLATFRAGRLNAKVTLPGLGTFDDAYSFTSYGASVDRDNIVAQGEFAQRRSGNAGDIVNSNAWYVMGGYRFGALLPYAIVSRGAPLQPDFPIHTSNTQRTTALGLRWDAFKAADLKFQVDRIDTNGTNGISFSTPPGRPLFPGGPAPTLPVTGRVLAFSVAMDFTF